MTDELTRSSVSDIPQFRIGRTILLGFSYLVTNLAHLTGSLIQFVILGVSLGIGYALVVQSVIEPELADRFLTIASLLIAAPISVAVHRAVVLDEPINALKYLAGFLDRRVWRFIGYGTLMVVFVWIATAIATAISTAIYDSVGLALVRTNRAEFLISFGRMLVLLTTVVAGIFVFQYIFIFPAIAIDESSSLTDARQLMRGRFWKVLAAMLIIALPAVLLQNAVMATDDRILLVILSMLSVYSFALFPAVLSVAYKSARTNLDKEASRSSQTSR